MESIELSIITGHESTTVDLTSEIEGFCAGKGDGLVSIFVPHATAGVAIFETGAGSDSDVLGTVDDLLPATSGRWKHEHGTPGHGRDHVLPVFISPSIVVPVQEGRMILGRWQSVVLVDTNVDNPVRRVRLSFVPG